MFKEIELLSAGQIAELRKIAQTAKFVDGRISNPHSKVKQNLQLHDEAAYQRSSQLLLQAMMAHEDFRNFAFPVAILPPLMTRYTPNMRYGAHADAAFLQVGNLPLRSDLSCTLFPQRPENLRRRRAPHSAGNARHPLPRRGRDRYRLPVRHAPRGRAGYQG